MNGVDDPEDALSTTFNGEWGQLLIPNDQISLPWHTGLRSGPRTAAGIGSPLLRNASPVLLLLLLPGGPLGWCFGTFPGRLPQQLVIHHNPPILFGLGGRVLVIHAHKINVDMHVRRKRKYSKKFRWG